MNGVNIEQLEMLAGEYAPAIVSTRNINTGLTDRKNGGFTTDWQTLALLNASLLWEHKKEGSQIQNKYLWIQRHSGL